MSDTAIRIEPDPGPWPGAAYANCWPVGGEIRGQVHVSSPQGQKSRRTLVELSWFTRGRGDRDRGAVATAELLVGDTPPGPNWTYPFRLSIPPEGPISYQGHLIQVVWHVRAWLDIPWGKDIEGTHEFTVMPV